MKNTLLPSLLAGCILAGSSARAQVTLVDASFDGVATWCRNCHSAGK